MEQLVTNRDVKLLDEFLTEKGIEYVLTGTVGLGIHGILPEGCEAHDIDIIVPLNINDPVMVKGVFTELEALSGCKYDDEHYDHRVYIFKIGKSNIKVNAFENNILGHQPIYRPIHFREINFEGHLIKVHDAFDILEAKFSLGRPKDYQFCVKLLNQISALLPCSRK